MRAVAPPAETPEIFGWAWGRGHKVSVPRGGKARRRELRAEFALFWRCTRAIDCDEPETDRDARATLERRLPTPNDEAPRGRP